MATTQEIVERSLRRIGIVAVGSSPTAEDLSGGLAALNEMISSWKADGLATADQSLEGRVTNGSAEVYDLETTANLAVDMFVSGAGIPSGARIKSIVSPTQITLTAEATADGNAVTLNFTALPFDAAHEAGVVAMLAVRLAEDYGKTPGPVLLRDADRGEERLRAAFTNVPLARVDWGLTRTPSQIIRGDE